MNGWTLAAIGAITLFLVASAFGIWSFVRYSDQKSNVDSKVALEVATARKEQAEEDEKKFAEREKNPRQQFVGPAEYGRVSFMYPKTWSVYTEKDGSDRGDVRVYLHPAVVPSVVSSAASRFALRLEILNKDFAKVAAEYDSLLKKGDIASSTLEYNGNAATRFDGAFSKELRGAVVLMRVRDKTIRFSTDADVFKPDFKAVLDTVTIAQ